MRQSRRAFLLTGISAIAAGLAGCGRVSPAAVTRTRCDARSARGPIRIDMHAHILNLRDVSAGPFVARRFLNYDESDLPGLDAAAGLVAGTVADFAKIVIKQTRNETGALRYELKTRGASGPPLANPTGFCAFAEKDQKGLIKATGPRQRTGMFSNKTRNAARMAEVYPGIDIFMPSMVDLYDDRRSQESLPQQVAYYEALNLVTGGRYLPMVSFNPQRHYYLQDQLKVSDSENYLRIAEDAIDNRGFVAFKIHGSSGFSPDRNLTYGCTNTPAQLFSGSDRDIYDRFTAYDRSMRRVLEFSADRDVPILTHGSTGITANRRCMRGPRLANGSERPRGPYAKTEDEWRYLYRRWGRIGNEDSDAPLEWTNSPRAWDRVSRQYGVRVCISHFANSFAYRRDRDRRIVRDPSGRPILDLSPWLRETVEAALANPRLYIDVSIITEFFEEVPGATPPFRLRKAYRDAFKWLIDAAPRLRRQLLYGTDWHMPDTANTGSYFESLIFELLRGSGLSRRDIDGIMGENAADFFGLRRGRPTRRRLERFYREAGVKYAGRPYGTDQIDWMAKLDG